MKLISVHGRPLAMLEDEAFQDLINMASSSTTTHITVNIKSTKELILEQAANIRNKIWEELKNSMFSLKIDSVTCAERKFLGINIQYIKKSEIIIRNLAVIEVHSSQTGNHLKNIVEEVLVDYRLSKEQIYSICTDNGSNMIRMTKLIGGKYYIDNEFSEDDYIEDEGEQTDFTDDVEIFNFDNFKIRGMLCAAHTLQLAIKDAIDDNTEVQAIINLARHVVNILRKPNNVYKLQAAKLGKPINDCRTRWTSTYNMLNRLKTFKDICSTLPEISNLITDDFWENINSILECLKPPHDATIALQRSNLTIGDFYITWINCKSQFDSLNNNFARSLFNFMQARETILFKNDVVLEALYLDKRINLLLTPGQCEKAKKLLKETYSRILKNITENNVDNSISSTPPILGGMLAIENMLQRAEQSSRPVRQINLLEASLNEVYGERIPLTENIIRYWETNTENKPREISLLAKTVLAAPATQVSVERLFSSLKFILNPLRTNLNEFFLRDLMLIRENKDLL